MSINKPNNKNTQEGKQPKKYQIYTKGIWNILNNNKFEWNDKTTINKENLDRFKKIWIIIDENIYNNKELKLYEINFDFEKFKKLKKIWFNFREASKTWTMRQKINNIEKAKHLININNLKIDYNKIEKLIKYWFYINENSIEEYNKLKINFTKLEKLQKLWFKLSMLLYRDIERIDKIEIDLDKFKQLWINFSKISINELKNLGEIQINTYKLEKLKELWLSFSKIWYYNIKHLNELEIDFDKLTKLKKIWINISETNIEDLNKLEITDEEISLCKKYWINEYSDILLFISILKNTKRQKIKEFINRKNEYLKNNQTISEEKFKELFWWSGKYWKTEINQRWIGLCFAYTWFELLKKTNWFDELIQTNLKENENWWEVRFPFCDPNGIWIKVNKEEIDKELTIPEKDWKDRTFSINSESEYLWFKILEIAFIKRSIISDKIMHFALSLLDDSIEKAFEQYENTWDFTITGKLIENIEWWKTEDMLYTILPKDYLISGFTDKWLNDKMKNLAFNQFTKWLFKIWIWIHWLKDLEKDKDTEITTIETERYWTSVIVNNVKIINQWWIEITSRFSLDNKWTVTDKKKSNWENAEYTKNMSPDIITNKEWKDVAMFFQNHAYSIEKCYIDNQTWEKRVWVINPRHTWIKFDISLKQCKNIFARQVTWIDIDKIFR